ncbi:helix-turn-helix transcriptional regulator [Leuconostocaceae bacterium ESL0958]|nr:helix-turn-helix transcriptional regulator [Leuconostocaceae bacterium ESL0958]
MNQSNLPALRKEKGWTQEALAASAHVTVRTVQRVEAGETVSLPTLEAIANTFSIPVNELFTAVGEPDQEEAIMAFAKEQSLQLQQRRAEASSLALLLIAVDFTILSLTGIAVGRMTGTTQSIWGTAWSAGLFLILAASIYLFRITINNYLNRKYPKTVGMKKQSQHQPIENGWQFLAYRWWLIFPIGGFLFGLFQAWD